MHEQSLRLMTQFARTVPAGAKVLDVGSRDVNGTFRDLFPNHDYLGIDIEPGPNVDIVVEPFNYPFEANTFDVIVSGSCLEHVTKPWKWIREVSRILKLGGRLCVIVPYQHAYHEHPVDCWRVFPEGMRALFEEAGLSEESIQMHDGTDQGFHPILQERIVSLNSDGFCDTIGIATK